ncbi:MAG: glutamine--fructose-6-phosphate transaminase (isomerizing), partial [Spirochaetes bacterium]|nr:glutamine--fructose-6-phosphate transaminase (isomerizing) [Spirochaetota bacterium]
MCGIVGYIGFNNCKDILIEGLKKLEYRGYDSAGIAMISSKNIIVVKEKGKVSTLENLLENNYLDYKVGIAHTRWATHGEPSKINSHPQIDCTGDIALVHNGIIENYSSLKKYLQNKGHKFVSETDTEIFAHLIEENYQTTKNMIDAIVLSMKEVVGSYAFAIISKYEPDKIFACKKGSPLIIGKGKDEMFLASDIAAIIKYTKDIIYVEEEEIVILTKDSFAFYDINKSRINKNIQKVLMDISEIEKGGFPHYMLKEIYEQPQTIENAIRGRIDLENSNARLDGLDSNIERIKKCNRIILSGCGTSWHAALIGKYYIENFARIPTEVEYASEFRYRNPVLNENTLTFFISQSGETADTIAALREAKRKGSLALGICNVVNSTIARETDGGVYLHAGPEIGVASTKAFTSQITVLFLISILLGRLNNLSFEESYSYLEELKNLPNKVNETLKYASLIEDIANKIANSSNAIFLGRGVNFPVALEGALKLKEISYIHAEGYPAAEMKHGPIALIDENMPVIFIATQDPLYEKIISNIEEVKARKGQLIIICNENDDKLRKYTDFIIPVPKTLPLLSPIVNVIPLQLLSYCTAVKRGCNVD